MLPIFKQTASPAAILAGKKAIALGFFGQSNQRFNVYNQLFYTPSAFSGNGSVATITTSIANNLAIGSVIKGKVSGATPAGYNTSGFVDMTVVGTYPNGQLQYASTGTGALSVAGTVTLDAKLTYPQAFASLQSPAMSGPIAPVTARDVGGYQYRLYDRLLSEWGVTARLVNGCIGSIGFIKYGAGQIEGYSANAHYRVARSPEGPGDMGCTGSLIVPTSNKLFECTAGGDKIYAVWDGPMPIPGKSPKVFQADYLVTVSGGTTGGSAPNWAAATTVGDTVVDNGITWTLRSANTTSDTDFAFSGTPATGTILSEYKYGFDPFGLCYRLHREMQRIKGVHKKYICLQNGEGDVQGSSGVQATIQAWYTSALQAIANYFVNRGYEVFIGLTSYNPNAQTYQYDSLSAGVAAAVASYSSGVYAGANLYTLFGSTPGSNNLFLQTDNLHVAENVHLQAAPMLASADEWFTKITAVVPRGGWG